MEVKKTSILVDTTTTDLLKKFKIVKKESYEEIILRMIRLHEEKLNEQKQNLHQ